VRAEGRGEGRGEEKYEQTGERCVHVSDDGAAQLEADLVL